jgi:hypothetical protein
MELVALHIHGVVVHRSMAPASQKNKIMEWAMPRATGGSGMRRNFTAWPHPALSALQFHKYLPRAVEIAFSPRPRAG